MTPTPLDRELALGTRGSPLALWQAHAVAAAIAAAGGPPCRIVTIKTSGDRLQEAPLSEAGGKGLFVKEIEDALLCGEIDLAVHSSKDMSVSLPAGLTIAAVLPREDPRDAVVLPPASVAPSESLDAFVARLGRAPLFGTSSVRRIAQLARIAPGARCEPIRGNLDTRLRKLDDGAYDAIVLAAAGLRRLGRADRISMALPASACVPAPGQGIVAVECREDNETVREIARRIHDADAGDALVAERAVIHALGGGCQTPIGAWARVDADNELDLVAVVVALDGRRIARASARGPRQDAAGLGTRVAAQLLADGAGGILAEVARGR